MSRLPDPHPTIQQHAQAAWLLAWSARHEDNWGRLVEARNRLEKFLRSPYPGVRRLASDLVSTTCEGGIAA